jgi:hypothetical protein
LEIIQRQADANKRAAELQEADGGDLEQGMAEADVVKKPPKTFIYTPQPIATY